MSFSGFSKDKIIKLAKSVNPQQIKWRREFHQFPELSDEEFRSTEFIKNELKKARLKIRPTKMKTGVSADLIGEKTGPVVAIRTDIDALPVIEATNLPFASKNKGIMHACGHDIHMATVLGVAVKLAEIKEQIKGTVRFLFQPAEEKSPGGARPMIAEGVLDNVDLILGLHVDPNLAVGKIGLLDGPTMGAVYDFDLIIKGGGGHAARPHDTVDSIVVSAEVIESLQKVISRETDPIAPTLITFGKINGGVARNVIPDEVKLSGTARSLSPTEEKRMPALIKRTVQGICKARGAKFEIINAGSYPMLVNNRKVNQLLAASYSGLFGKNKVTTTDPLLGGEDFACYLQKVPGAFFWLGIRNNKIGANQPWHSPRFIVDENSIFYGTSALIATTLNFIADKK